MQVNNFKLKDREQIKCYNNSLDRKELLRAAIYLDENNSDAYNLMACQVTGKTEGVSVKLGNGKEIFADKRYLLQKALESDNDNSAALNNLALMLKEDEHAKDVPGCPELMDKFDLLVKAFILNKTHSKIISNLADIMETDTIQIESVP